MPRTPLVGSFYIPGRGGHAPGDLREAFGDAIEAYELWNDGEPEPTVEVREKAVLISAVCGYLWNCGDIMPHMMVDAINDLTPFDPLLRRTYAAGARKLKSMIA